MPDNKFSQMSPADREVLRNTCPELLEELDERTLFPYREMGEDMECNVSLEWLFAIARRFLAIEEEK